MARLFFTAFSWICFLIIIHVAYAVVIVRLKLEVFLSPKLLKNLPISNGIVRVRLKKNKQVRLNLEVLR